MRESDVERHLRDRVRAVGGRAYKWVSPGNNGVPDRIVMLPNAPDIFVELKAPGKKSTALQLVQHKILRELGRPVIVIDSKEKVDRLIEAYEDGLLEYCIQENAL
ncbi:VRR-NUC domain-containing protein [Cohnella cholangitidis]|uniref:VRR-NUC domain-containing protein n=1 Tax=Cohnella cholangitidis TaxID=2598458 RepID=A0A7G5C5H0_9BACL|nr:VRR-NUC domain-containing protein [Cohnella cholangitidis]QMV44454.1 VRR-NUC domain-containing protein [Cohnella cholangitidis]